MGILLSHYICDTLLQIGKKKLYLVLVWYLEVEYYCNTYLKMWKSLWNLAVSRS